MVKLEYKVGPLTVNFRVLFEPKGFLRIIIMFVALFAFALTAGFNGGGDANRVTCTSTTTGAPNYTATVNFYYPYDPTSFSVSIQNPDNFTDNKTECRSIGATSLQAFSSSAQFFVALGVLTIIYVAGALLVYMLFITPELYMAKWLVIGDLFATLLFGALYTVASIAWSAGAATLNSYLASLMNSFAVNCFSCDNSATAFSPRTQPFTQAAIAAIFGWLASFIWFASVWFVYKDTMWHKDETGPLAKVYEVTKEKRAARETTKQDQVERGDGGEGDADQ